MVPCLLYTCGPICAVSHLELKVGVALHFSNIPGLVQLEKGDTPSLGLIPTKIYVSSTFRCTDFHKQKPFANFSQVYALKF